MSLSTFSRLFSPKSPLKSPVHRDNPDTPHSPASVSSHGRTNSKCSPTSKRDARKTRDSRTFAFSLDSLNVLASFRARNKSRATQLSQTVSHYSYSSRSGYEDEEYGEPEAEAEEIRRPSGLGRRVSVGDEAGDDAKSVTDSGKVVKTASQGGISRISESSDEGLGEIRCPSGLGHHKLVANTVEIERPISTYPLFPGDMMEEDNDTATPVALREKAVTSFELCAILPLLNAYLSRQALTSLALVNHAVAHETRKLLWRDIRVGVSLFRGGKGPMMVDGDKSAMLLDALSTQRELACLVQSLELPCRLESRYRRPPLLLSPVTTPRPFRPHAAPFSNLSASPSPTRTGHSTPASESPAPPVSISKHLRRASSLLRPSLPSLRPPSMRLPRPLSILRTRSVELLSSRSAETPSPISHSPHKTAASLNLLPLPGDSTWSPPSEWERATPVDVLPCVSPASSLPASSASTPLCSSPMDRPRVHPILPQPLPLATLSTIPTLHLSPSLPSLRVPPPPRPRPASYHPQTQDTPYQIPGPDPSPSTTAPPTPVTPYSAISLSAFPFPPLSTPPLVSPLPRSFPRQTEGSTGLPSPLTITTSPIWGSSGGSDILPRALYTALGNMVNLARITVIFSPLSTSTDPSGSTPHSLNSTSPGSDLVSTAKDVLREAFSAVESLKNVDVCMR